MCSLAVPEPKLRGTSIRVLPGVPGGPGIARGQETGPLEPPRGDRDVNGASGRVGSACPGRAEAGVSAHLAGGLGVALATTTSGPAGSPRKSHFAPPAGPAGGEALPLRRPRPASRGGPRRPEDSRPRPGSVWPAAGAMEAFTRFTNQTQGRDRLFR